MHQKKLKNTKKNNYINKQLKNKQNGHFKLDLFKK